MSEAPLSLYPYVKPPAVTMQSLLRETAADHGLTAPDLMADTRKRFIAHARQDFMWRARQIRTRTGEHRYSFPMIGRFLGGMDHTTVVHGVRAHSKRLAEAQGRANAA
jgi:chromosomal replication initiator protein